MSQNYVFEHERYCLICGAPAPCETHVWRKLSDIIVSGYDVYGEPMEETIRDVYTGPDFYFWLGADAYPEWPVVTRIEISR